MKFKSATLCASSTVTLLLAAFTAATPGAALAQTASAANGGATELGEIVVTARRRTESLQEVPQTVNAVTADTLKKLNILQFQDIQTVVPGLTLSQSQGPTSGEASLRGVTYNSFTGASPSVAFYLNDAPVGPPELFQSLFDVGQIEVLKGPQGTTRGVSAPSGAITVTTRRPDLSSFGGYVDVSLSDQQGRNAQGALNIPVIKDVLAIRLAGIIDQNDGDGVRSIHSLLRSTETTSAERISVSFEPSDAFNANVAYQHFDRKGVGFNGAQVAGVGAGDAVDPPLVASDRASVLDQPSIARTHMDAVTMQLDSRLFGQHLSYTGSYRRLAVNTTAASDTGDVLPGGEFFQLTTTRETATTHEIRLASDPAPGRFFDYTLGAFYSWSSVPVESDIINSFFPGAFGPPDQPPNTAFINTRYSLPLVAAGTNEGQETSVFGSVTLHLGQNTELSGGMRHIIAISNGGLNISFGNATLALPASVLGGNCGAFGSTYPGFCDLSLDLGGGLAIPPNRSSAHPNIYNVSLSHHFSRDLLGYFTTGTSWRPPINVPVAPTTFATSDNPDLQVLAFHPAETSVSYEVGVKWTFLDGRARLNLSGFRQRFRNEAFLQRGILFRDITSGQVSTNDTTANADVLVQGFDLDSAWQITRDWNISLQGSYAHGAVQSSRIPCNTGSIANPNFNTGDAAHPAIPGDPTSGLISLCSSGTPSRLPLWSLTAQTEYVHPVSDKVDGFVRGLLNYYPENKYVEQDFTAGSYALLNLFAGVRSHDGAWELSVFARNVTGTKATLDQSSQLLNLNGVLGQSFSGPVNGVLLNRSSGYYQIAYTPPREIGVHLQYAWGSR